MREKEYDKLKNSMAAMEGRLKAEMCSQRMDMNDGLSKKVDSETCAEMLYLERKYGYGDEHVVEDAREARIRRLSAWSVTMTLAAIFMAGVTVGMVISQLWMP